MILYLFCRLRAQKDSFSHTKTAATHILPLKSAPDFPTITFVRGRRQAASCAMDEDTAAGIGWSFKRGASIVMFFYSKGIPPAIVGKQVYPKTISPISSALSTRYLGQRASSSVRGRNPHVTPQAVTRALSAVCISTAESPT